jgi:cytochrome c oxidase subunit 3
MATARFHSADDRRDAATLGMWVFLATEVLFFGPLFFGYVHSRLASYEAFVSGSHHMHFWLGTINTAILLTSSLTMALAVEKRTHSRVFLSCTALLGIAFLCIKGYEYASEVPEVAAASGAERIFYLLYFAMTGLHALHLVIGIALIAWLWLTAPRYGPEYYAPLEVTGLYWHFVDVVWVFLYPMFYLLERYAA